VDGYQRGAARVLRRALSRLSRTRAAGATDLAYRAFHDALTGLPNRGLFDDRLQQAFARARRSGTTVALLFCDLDHFKAINDTHGHLAGDELLVGVARRLESAVRPSDTVARLGGDEFTVLLEHLREPADAVRLAERVAAALEPPVTIAGAQVRASASIGVAFARRGHVAPNELVRDADAAMYRAKQGGGGRFEIFDPALAARQQRRAAIGRALHRALDSADVTLRYEPIVDSVTGKVVGVEARAQWHTPSAVSAAELAATAEELGLATALAWQTLRTACAEASAWLDLGDEPLPVGLDLSAAQLRDPSFVARVADALAACDIDHGLLTLEVPEAAVAEDPAAARDVLRALADLGVDVVLDAVGDGASAFNILSELPLSGLKVGPALPAAGVAGLLALGRSAGLRVVGTGVADCERLETLRTAGCALLQGPAVRGDVAADEVASVFRRRRAPVSPSLRADGVVYLRRAGDPVTEERRRA
jgi:diguanylate cyclase (GGDEF)-like protein